ncbi:PQQ-binding-like beta-propeller repeat protein [Planctomycetota bacterium]
MRKTLCGYTLVFFVIQSMIAFGVMGDEGLFKAAGTKSGLIIHLGAGQPGSAGLTAALTQKRGLPVHGLALDNAALDRARKAIVASGVSGRAMVEKLPKGKSLPYLSNLASLIVVEDMAALAARGITRVEILRVLAPDGTLCMKKGSAWAATVKPRPKEMDDWTHPHHGPDGNLVSNDKALSFPISLRWIAGTPFVRGGFASCAGNRAVVLAGGRCFTVSVDDRGSPAPSNSNAFLLARDAYSGFPLWKLDCQIGYGKVELDWRNVWPIAATETCVYAGRKNDVVILNAATGEIKATCPTKYRPKRLILIGKYLVAASWEKKEVSNHKDGFENDGIRAVWWPGGAGSVEAFNPGTGKPLWTLPLTVLTMVASDGTLFVLTHQGNPPTKRDIISIDLATGKEKWRVAHTAFGKEADTCLNFAGLGCVVLSKTKGKGKRQVSVLSAVDGKILYQIPGETARNIVGKELWCSKGRFDLKTGKKIPGGGVGRTYAGSNIVGGCVPPIIVGGRYITGSRRGSFLQLPDGPGKRPVRLSYAGARGACLQGMVPANGMLYTAQNNCACFSGQIGGFLAIGPCGGDPVQEDFTKPRPIEKGPAFGSSGPAASPDDWPCYRQNTERSGGTGTALPTTLKILWKVKCVNPGKDKFGDAWNARIGGAQPLTAPIIAAGSIFIAGLDTGEVIALNPADGSMIWKTVLGSRIDSPPSYYKGLLLAGCHDGWAYALRAKDGVLAYRIRIAPLERRMVAYGIVESVWPATGAVLIYEGIAYTTAGRSSKTDGGIALVAFKPETGETLWAKVLGKKLTLLVDVPVIRKGELTLRNLRMDLKTGKELAPAQRFYNQYAMIDGSWISGYGKRSGRGFNLGKACSSMMAWNDKLVVVPGRSASREKIEIPKPAGKAKAKHPDRWKPDEVVWSMKLKPHIQWSRVYAMALSSNTAFFAGSVFTHMRRDKYAGSFLWSKSMADGKTQQGPIKLDSFPVYDGLAIGGGRVYLTLQSGELLCFGE